jgi:charged multivesicular body protein 4A/B
LSATDGGYDDVITRVENRNLNKVDETMEAINAQREIANEISEAISNPVGAGIDIDEVRFQ